MGRALLASLLLAGCRPDTAPPAPTLLLPGKALEQLIEGGGRHAYRVALAAGDFLHIEVDQRGVDVVARLAAPGGKELLDIDSPSDDLGAETLLVVATEAGEHRVEIEAFPGRGGRYALEVKALRPATEVDRLRAAATAAESAGAALAAAGDFSRAEQTLAEAAAVWLRLGEIAGQAHIEDRLGRLASRRQDHQGAVLHHQRAGLLFTSAGLPRWRGISLSAQGTALYVLGELRAAQRCFEEALPLRAAAGDFAGEAAVLRSLGDVHQLLGEPGRALELYEGSLERQQQRGEEEVDTVHNLGLLLLTLGRPRDALDRLREAEAAARRANDEGRRAGTLLQIGRAQALLDHPDEAAESFELALVLAKAGRDRRMMALALSHLGILARREGQQAEARRRHEEALPIFRELGDHQGEGAALTNLGSVALSGGDLAEAEARFAAAASLLTAESEPSIRSANLLGQARVAARLGRLEEAFRAVEAAVNLAESSRRLLDGPALTASFAATTQPTFELWVDVLMPLHRRHPSAGWDRRALAASERGRARSFLDAAALASSESPRAEDGGDSSLAGAESALRQRLNALEAERSESLLRAAPPSRIAALEQEIRRALTELDRGRRQLRAADPRRAALRHLAPLSADELERMLPSDTALLEIALASERSHLWVLTAGGLTSRELPGRHELEWTARRTYELLARSHRREAEPATRKALCRLSRLLLAPAAEAIAGRRRLLIVTEGALLYLPFAALPDPEAVAAGDCPAAAPPLAARFTVTHLPSASLLAALAAPRAGRQWQGELAVVGDPTAAPQEALGRLPFSRLEAEAVLAQAPAGRSLAVLGHSASKETVLSGRLAGFRRLHFATHGVVNPLHAKLSGLVLSTVDEAGKPRDGFLRAYEIADLELPAELVVLSACRTGLGVEMPGEGLVGLTRSFFEAGSRSLLVSLWSIDDRSTAELMRRFYRELFTFRREPAEALARAQAAMAAEPVWRAPYRWAGFVLQGGPH